MKGPGSGTAALLFISASANFVFDVIRVVCSDERFGITGTQGLGKLCVIGIVKGSEETDVTRSRQLVSSTLFCISTHGQSPFLVPNDLNTRRNGLCSGCSGSVMRAMLVEHQLQALKRPQSLGQ